MDTYVPIMVMAEILWILTISWLSILNHRAICVYGHLTYRMQKTIAGVKNEALTPIIGAKNAAI